jgi:hypothetical protein
LFENVDATDHPQEDVRDEFNKVVRRLLGPGFAFDAVAVGSSAHRHRRWWTNLAPNNLLLEMVEKKFKLQKPDQYVRKHLEPGRQAQNARNSAAPGKHSVNVPGQPLRAFSTFVTVKGSHAFRPGQQSMVHDTSTGLWDEPSALERERAMGFMDNTTCAPSLTEADRRHHGHACPDLFGG